MKRCILMLMTLVLAVAPLLPAAGESAPIMQVETLLSDLLQSEMTRSGAHDLQDWIDGPLAATAGQGAEWTILALAQLQGNTLPPCDLTAYQIALEAFLSQEAAHGASTRQKYALCMLAAGGDATVAETAQTSLGQQGIMSWIYGLHLLNNGCIGPMTPAEAAAQLVSLRLPDGGWALMGQHADVDVTAMALQALAPHREDPAVAAAIAEALTLLQSRQQPDGGFVSMGQPNPESAAQVMIALCSLGIDPLGDERFVKDGATMLDSIMAYRLPEGGYAHAKGSGYSAAATVQVLDALTAHVRFAKGLPGLYLLDGAGGQGAANHAGNAATTDDTASAVTTEHTPDITVTANTPDTATDTIDSHVILDTPATSIGIIGGADGPTAIYLSGANRWKTIAISVILVLAVFWCLTLLIRRKKKLKSYLSVALVAAVLLGGVLALDIQLPEHYYGASPGEGNIVGSVTLEIRCDALAKEYTGEYIPEDGIILPKTVFFLKEGDTVYDLLTEAVRQNRLHLDASGSEGMKYVSGLNHLYEQAYGELSGWMFFVNGESASQSCDQYLLKDGDHVSWQYTLAMGQDLE